MKNFNRIIISMMVSSLILGVTACQDKQEQQISKELKGELIAFVEIMDENIEKNKLIYERLSEEANEVSQVLEAFYPEDEYIESIEKLFDSITMLERQGHMIDETEEIVYQVYAMYQVASIHQRKIIEKILSKVAERQATRTRIGYTVSIPTTRLSQYDQVEKELVELKKKSIGEVLAYYEELKDELIIQLEE